MKKFFTYISYLLTLPFLIFFINLKIGFHNEDFNKKFVEDLILNDSLTIKMNLNERQIVKSRINYQNNFKRNVVLGSSRSLLIGKPIHFDVDNYSMSGAIIDDFENVYTYLKINNIKIDSVFIEVSPWIFNDKTGESRFKGFNSPSLKRRIKKLFSLYYLKDNLNPYKYFPVESEKDFIKYSDGSIRYDYEYRNQDNLNSIKRYLQSKDIYHLEGFNSIKKINYNRFKKLVDLIIKDGSVPILVKHPYPPMINNKILERYPNIKLTEKIVDSIIDLYNIKSFGSFDPERLNITNNDFYDGMHLTPKGIKKLLER